MNKEISIYHKFFSQLINLELNIKKTFFDSNVLTLFKINLFHKYLSQFIDINKKWRSRQLILRFTFFQRFVFFTDFYHSSLILIKVEEVFQFRNQHVCKEKKFIKDENRNEWIDHMNQTWKKDFDNIIFEKQNRKYCCWASNFAKTTKQKRDNRHWCVLIPLRWWYESSQYTDDVVYCWMSTRFHCYLMMIYM
jgi:hypothetical protein